MPQKTKLKALFRVTSTTPNGVLDIIECLKEGYSQQLEEYPINITVIAPPKYMIATNTIKPK
jgi:translation initiation factor 2 alpha subunit (eIF-2alpha)